MAWNTEETRRRLKVAAAEEFAEHGLAGTTMQRIASRAGVNKERIYNYFGDKDGMFASVLNDELAKAAEAVPLDSLRSGALGTFAGQVFDYHAANPHLLRLLHWEAVAYGGRKVPNEAARRRFYRDKVDALRAAQSDGLVSPDLDPAETVFLLMAMAVWWFAAPQVDRMLSGGRTRESRSRQRAALVLAAERMGAVAATRVPTN